MNFHFKVRDMMMCIMSKCVDKAKTNSRRDPRRKVEKKKLTFMKTFFF